MTKAKIQYFPITCEAHSVSYSVFCTGGGGGHFPYEAKHLPLSGARLKRCGAIPPLSHCVMECCLIKHRDDFTLLLAH